jgi:hypothetical protein
MAVALSMIGALLLPMSAASADPASCPPDPWWNFSSVTSAKYSLVPPSYGDSGLTISIALTAGATATATASITGTASLSGIFASASVAIGVSFSLALTASVTYTAAYTVPLSADHAFLYAGALGKSFQWSKWQYVGCVGKRVAYGSAKGPYALPAFWHVVYP